MGQTDIERGEVMIRVNCGKSIFKDILTAIDSYTAYQKIIGSTPIENPFVDDVDGLPIISLRDKKLIASFSHKVIMVDMITEGFNVLYHLREYPRDKKYILFSNGSWHQSWADLEIDYIVINWNYFLYDYVNRALNPRVIDSWQDKDYKFNKNKEFVFSALIGDKRTWRDFLVEQIRNCLTFDNYVLNYFGQELKQSSRYDDIPYDFNQFNSVKSIYQHYTLSSSIPINLYNKSRLLLIAESTMHEHDEFHLTEKTIKALLTGIPFVICGSYKFLEQLRALGFKTYSEVWSEDYDLIQNNQDRIASIVGLLNDISTMDWDQATVDKLQNIAYHNKLQLLNVNSIMKQQLLTIVDQFKDFNI